MTGRIARSAGRGQQGVALVAVLWGVLLLSLLAVSFASRAGTDARLVRNELDRAEAASLADAGVYWALRELLRPAEARRIIADGSAYAIAFRGVQLRVAVQDEAGKVDLNAAPPALLQSLLLAAGAGGAKAERIAAAIADWRDRDDDVRPGGAEAADYAAAGLATGPRNAPFLLLDELRAVMGMTPALYEAAAPLLTVYSGAAGVDPLVAPAAVLKALPGVSPERARAAVESRRGMLDAAELLGGAASVYFTDSPGRIYGLRVALDLPSGVRFVRHALVQFTAQPNQPYRFLRWEKG